MRPIRSNLYVRFINSHLPSLFTLPDRSPKLRSHRVKAISFPKWVSDAFPSEVCLCSVWTENDVITGNHSSRMRTTHLPTVHVLVAATSWIPTQQVPYLEEGWVLTPGYSLLLVPTTQKGTLDQGPSSSCEQTDANENITFSQLRWRAIIYNIAFAFAQCEHTLAISTEDSYLSPCSSLLTSLRAWGVSPSLTS